MGLPIGRSSRQAIKNAGIEPSDIDYVETHGTGTVLGDPIEVEALAEVVGAPREDKRQCVLGAAKADLGHLEAAAGLAGLIKIVLSMQHNAIPPRTRFPRTQPPHFAGKYALCYSN